MKTLSLLIASLFIFNAHSFDSVMEKYECTTENGSSFTLEILGDDQLTGIRTNFGNGATTLAVSSENWINNESELKNINQEVIETESETRINVRGLFSIPIGTKLEHQRVFNFNKITKKGNNKVYRKQGDTVSSDIEYSFFCSSAEF